MVSSRALKVLALNAIPDDALHAVRTDPSKSFQIVNTCSLINSSQMPDTRKHKRGQRGSIDKSPNTSKKKQIWQTRTSKQPAREPLTQMKTNRAFWK